MSANDSTTNMFAQVDDKVKPFPLPNRFVINRTDWTEKLNMKVLLYLSPVTEE